MTRLSEERTLRHEPGTTWWDVAAVAFGLLVILGVIVYSMLKG